MNKRKYIQKLYHRVYTDKVLGQMRKIGLKPTHNIHILKQCVAMSSVPLITTNRVYFILREYVEQARPIALQEYKKLLKSE